MVVTATYETTDPTIDSQITTLQASGADVLLVAASAIPPFWVGQRKNPGRPEVV
jgi:hypothetical protein